MGGTLCPSCFSCARRRCSGAVPRIARSPSQRPRRRASRRLVTLLTRPRCPGRCFFFAPHLQRALPGEAAPRALHERGVPSERRVRRACGAEAPVHPLTWLLVCLGRAVFSDGTLCMDIIQDQWSPIHNVSTLLTSIQARSCAAEAVTHASSCRLRRSCASALISRNARLRRAC